MDCSPVVTGLAAPTGQSTGLKPVSLANWCGPKSLAGVELTESK